MVILSVNHFPSGGLPIKVKFETQKFQSVPEILCRKHFK